MKKTVLLVIAAIAFCFYGFSQEWAPKEAKWWYTLDCFSTMDCGYYTLESNRDTLINGISAKILEINLFGGELFSSSGLPEPLIMYSEGEKVYHYDLINNEFYMLYDFALQAGDTLTIQDTTKFRGFYNAEDGSQKALFQVVVDSNVVKNFRGHPLKHLYTSQTSNSSHYFNGPIIEKVGNIIRLLGEGTIGMPGGFPGYFRCYKDNTIDLTTGNCEYVAGLNDFGKENLISISPNPFINYFEISGIDFSLIKEIEITNILGERQKTTILKNQVYLLSENKGIYFVTMELKNRERKIFKIVKI